MTQYPTSFNGNQAYTYLEHLSVDIGPRLTGSPGEHKAAHYIEQTFKSFGLKTRLQKYPVLTFDNKTCRFEVQERGRWRSVKCEPIMLTPSTPPRGLTGELYLLEASQPELFVPAMKDKIVMICGSVEPHHRPLLLAQKPKALVMIEGGLMKEISRSNMIDEIRRKFGDLPTIRIRHLDGMAIVKKGLTKARLTLRNTERKSFSYNVIGEKKGDAFPDEIVVVCAHYDTSMGVRGACDNGAGTAVMMELARVFAAEPTRRTLRFVAFSAEETGLNGSIFYADDLARKAEREKKRKGFREKIDKTELDKHRFTFNLDIHGFVIGSNNATYNGADDIGAAVRLLAKETGRPCGVSQAPMSSDGTPLAARWCSPSTSAPPCAATSRRRLRSRSPARSPTTR